MNFLFILVLSFTMAAALPAKQTTTPQQSEKAPQAWDAKTIVWQKVDPDGTKWAVLEGKSDVPGEAFTYAAFVPAGYYKPSLARFRCASRGRSGCIESQLRGKSGPGSPHVLSRRFFLLVPANVKHTMAADVDTIIIGTAVGPWGTHSHGEHQHH
jgi:hypothetical protein